MCWNGSVSLKFGLVHLMTLLLVYLVKPRHWKKFSTFLSFYILMEWFQAFQWYMGVGLIHESDLCTSINTYSTIFAYILIWLQPIMYCNFAKRNKFVKKYAIFTFVVAMINLFLGFWWPASEMQHLTTVGQTNYGNITCTYKGEFGHLLWKFQINTISYQPTHFVYYSIILLTIFMYYDNVLKWTIGLGWISSFLLTVLIHGINNELPSFWCLLSVVADIPIAFYCLYANVNPRKRRLR